MTMLSFRAEAADAAEAQRWANELGMDRSELLREALHRHITRLASEHDAVAWVDQPLTADEMVVGQLADWAPAEDWSDWADATR